MNLFKFLFFIILQNEPIGGQPATEVVGWLNSKTTKLSIKKSEKS